MNVATARDLLNWFTPEFLPNQDRAEVIKAGAELAARVKALTKACEFHDTNPLPPHARRFIMRVLNGEKP